MIVLEPVEPRSGPVSRNFDKLKRFVIDTAERTVGLRWGTATLTWAGGTQATGATTVAHGLGKAPSVVVATPINPGVNAWVWVGSPGSTTFLLAGQTAAAAPTAGTTMTACWLAIG